MSVSVADEVWISTALLHREHPERMDFDKNEIMERIRKEHLHLPERPGLSTHISSHAVAGKEPQPGKYRMLIETGRGRRRLFREGDVAHEGRTGKIKPQPEDVPVKYRPLLDWYDTWSKTRRIESKRSSFSSLGGRLKNLWGQDPVQYVRQLREES